jgi:hypothetical protein
MDCYHDPRRRETVIRFGDREVMARPEIIQQRVEDALLDKLVRIGLQRIRQPRAIPVKSSTCFIPRKKRNAT